jgi:hypothetical protein
LRDAVVRANPLPHGMPTTEFIECVDGRAQVDANELVNGPPQREQRR